MINFAMPRRLHRIQFSLESETDSGIIFPGALRHKAKDAENCFKICSLQNILAAIERAGKEEF